jgi:hypothetical protein
MYNLEESDLRRIQFSIIGYYKTSAKDRFRPEMSTRDAISIFNKIIGQNDVPNYEKTSIVAYLQRNLVHNSKLVSTQGMYRAS